MTAAHHTSSDRRSQAIVDESRPFGAHLRMVAREYASWATEGAESSRNVASEAVNQWTDPSSSRSQKLERKPKFHRIP